MKESKRYFTPTHPTPFPELLYEGLVAPMGYCDAEPVGHLTLDLREDEAGYLVQADVPGITRDKVHVSIQGNRVSISTDGRHVPQGAGECFLVRERYEGFAHRSLTLPEEVDADRATAKVAEGVLVLRLPKKATAKGRKLQIL